MFPASSRILGALVVALTTMAVDPASPTAIGTVPPSAMACPYIASWRGHDMPSAQSPPPSTTIVHAVAISDSDGWYVGWAIFTRAGRVWYLDGPVRAPFPPGASSRAALRLLGLERYPHRNSQMIPLPRADFTALINGGFQIKSCF